MTDENEETLIDVLKDIKEELTAIRHTLGSHIDLTVSETYEEFHEKMTRKYRKKDK